MPLPRAITRPARALRGALSNRTNVLAAAGLVIAIVLVAVGLLVRSQATGKFGDDPAPPEVERAVSAVLAGEGCTTADAAEPALRAKLSTVAGDWHVVRNNGLGSDDCVTAGVDSVNHQIMLLPALHSATRVALSAFGERLRNECLSKDEAIAALRTTLEGLGETGWDLRTEGTISGPADQMDEVERHVMAGCWIYNGTGWTAEGTRLYFLGGN